jgi:large subunit ribosomal protein L4
MKVDVINMQGAKVSTAELPASIFEAPIKPDLMHQALQRQLANARLGTHSTKTRGEVSGGGRKPWRQKGTGRARQGSTRSPIWVGGGKVHTPKPRSYAQRMPRKMRRAALRSALSAKAAQSEILVLDKLGGAAKTSEMDSALSGLIGASTALILLPGPDADIERAVRNLQRAKTLRAQYLNIRDLLGFDRLVIPMASLDVISAHLGGGEATG